MRLRIVFTTILLLMPFTLSAKTLHMVTCLDPIEAKEYIDAFEKDSGIDCEWIRLSAGEVLARLKTEGNNPSQSVWFGGPLPEFIAAKEAGLLEKYYPKKIESIPKKWRDADGRWIGTYYGYIGFITNNNFLKKHDLKPPTSWNDLIKPVYKGHVVISYPYTAGTGFTIFAGLVTEWGIDKAVEYWKKLDKQVHHYTKSGSAPVLEVGLGEAGAGVAFSQDVLRKGMMRNFPVTLSFPEDGVSFEIGGAAIIKNAPEPKEAKKFLDWIISLNAQNLMHKWARVPMHPDAKVRDDQKKPDEMKLIDMDFIELGEKRSKLIERWRSELRQ